jgi:putative ABC transport system permease protein
MFDLHLSLATGGFVQRGALLEAARSIPDADEIQAAQERLVGQTQVDASTATRTILVPGRIVGLDVTAAPQVTSVDTTAGRALRSSDRQRAVAVLDTHFARYYHLPAQGRIRVSGGSLAYVGQGIGPEYFLIVGEQGNLLAEANFAVVFTPLETAQRLLGRPGLVDDLVLTLDPGANAGAVRSQIAKAMRARLPNVGFELTGRQGDWSYRLLYRDIKSDQRFYTIFAILILAGAAFASFNLIGRMVEAQRREIGIGMSLGTPPRLLAVRPLLVGLEIALLGVVFGIGVGFLVGWLVGGLFRTYQPLPVWETPFQPLTFLRSAALGLVVPFLASAYPVWRAVRVPPVEAIRTGALTAKTGGLAPVLARIPLPGNSFVQMPFRNVLRTPRRPRSRS